MRGALIVACFVLAACQSEPDFDERYDNTAANIQERAAAIDAEIANEAVAGDDGGQRRSNK